MLNTGQAAEQAAQTPRNLPGGFIVGVDEVDLLINMDDIFIADCRSPFNYGKGHIGGARSLAYSINYHHDDAYDTPLNLDALPPDRHNPLLFYSHGSSGWKSYRAAQAAIAAGYTQVHWFREGLQAWLAAGKELEY
jgi:rhodanese-related sulfurtransferase